MKLFLTKLAIFIGIIFFIFVIIRQYADHVTVRKINHYIKEKTRIVITGDSHTQTAIYDKILPNSKNTSVPSETYFFSYNKIKRIIEEARIDTLIIGFSPHKLAYFQDKKLLGIKEEKRTAKLYITFFECLDIKSIFFLLQHNFRGVISVFPEIIKKPFDAKKRLEYSFIGFAYRSKKSNLDSKLIEKKIRIHYNKSKSEVYQISKYQIVYLNKLIGLCDQNNIKLILINIPVHPLYKEQIPKYYFNSYYDLVAQLEIMNVEFVDYSNIIYPVSCYGDGEHLNFYGAKLFSKKLVNDIKNNTLGTL